MEKFNPLRFIANQLKEMNNEAKEIEKDEFVKLSTVVEQVEEIVVEEPPPNNDPKEAIVVVYDVSGSMDCQYFDDGEISRQGAVNALFSAFADKTLAHNLNHIVQLFTFSTIITKKNEFNNDFENFINLVDGCIPDGCTALYDCML